MRTINISHNIFLVNGSVTDQHVSRGNFHQYFSAIYKFYFGIDRQLDGRTSLAIGVSGNLSLADSKTPDYEKDYAGIAPYHFTNHTFHNLNMKSWVGVKVTLRFFYEIIFM